MPPNEEGEWWELQDESREMPYYYHTKSGETQWTRPEGFVIPLGIIQVRITPRARGNAF
jgi:Rho GTPase-activating protein 39